MLQINATESLFIDALGNQFSTWVSSFSQEEERMAKSICSIGLKALIGMGSQCAIGYAYHRNAIHSFSFPFAAATGFVLWGITEIGCDYIDRVEFHRRWHKVQYHPEVESEVLFSDIFNLIIPYANFDTLNTLLEVSKGINGLIFKLNEQRKKAVEGIAFGKEEWFKFHNHYIEGNEPLLPRDIIQILNSFDRDNLKKIKDTHFFTLIPRDICVENFKELVHKTFGYRVNGGTYTCANASPEIKCYSTTLTRRSYWVLISKEILNGSLNKTFEEQQEIVSELTLKDRVNYQIPDSIEVIICFTMDLLRSKKCSLPVSNVRCFDRIFFKKSKIRSCVRSQGLNPVEIGWIGDDMKNLNTGILTARRFWELDIQ